MKKSKALNVNIAAVILFLMMPSIVVSAKDGNNIVKTSDSNGDGKIDTWSTYDSSGELIEVAQDKHRDGRPHSWKYYRNGKVYKREWDRNFDGKPDIRVFEENGRTIKTEYDNNFDGKFEKVVKAPEAGTMPKIKTSNEK